MEVQKTMGECGFDKLFTKSVPHILEKIFFSLDYPSFKTCIEVNTAWQELLSSESFKRLGKSRFREDIERDLWQVVGGGNAHGVRKVLSCGMVNVNCTDKENRTPLLFALENSFKDVAKLLLEEEADDRIAGGRYCNWLPIHVSAKRGYQDVVAQLLLEGGAEINMQDRFRMTPLHWASHSGHCGVAKLLLESGADLNIQCRSGYTPLKIAAMNGRIDVVKLFLKRGAETNRANQDGSTPLHFASLFGYKDVVQLLLDAGAEINMVTHTGHTPLGYATQRGHTNVVYLLKENGGIE